MLNGRYIVLIEDDALMGNSLVQRLELEGAEVTWVKQAVRGISAVRTPRKPVDAVICDIRLPDGSGEEIYITLLERNAPPPFLFITGQGEIDQAVRLLRAGGTDYMTKPFDMPAFLGRLEQIMRPDPSLGLPAQTGVSPLARQVDALVNEFAHHDWPILIRGERGLGKERIARRIHTLSERSWAPFIALNTLRDHVSDDDVMAAIRDAADGTLFLNGIGRLDDRSQNLLMEALHPDRIRLIATCGTRIDEKVESGGFRADLFYALVAHEIVVPPLSQRSEDAVWLANQMFKALNENREGHLRGISELALVAVRDHDWPGNGRELRSRLLRAIDVATGEWIFPTDIFPELNRAGTEIGSLADAREAAERRQIIVALERSGGQIAEAARLLKVSRTTLWEKMQKLGL
ncbi:MAG: sigma-54-dependent Fis family transcriptional regulator [Thioclava sp.]|nr:sigma 54-interacting transcriptional regulator [Thioclava sp.]MBD3801642.1 sigma-54-dependent Fis family transcriptional regulator [Thioclava sp.]